MSENLGIPISACYNRIRMLEGLGLLKCVEMKMSASGKKDRRLSIDASQGIHIYGESEVRVKLELIDGKVRTLAW